MTPTATVHASEGGTHWYSQAGDPMYEVPGRNGQPRPTTLRDARKLGLVPSVTTIIRCAAAPALEAWKVDQGILAALTLPRGDAEAEADWLARVKQDSQEQGRAAAERGTEIHAAIEAYYLAVRERGFGLTKTGDVVDAVVDAVYERYPMSWRPEVSFAHPLGFGGKVDLTGDLEDGDCVLIDFKTKDEVTDSTRGYEEQAMQLAAYREGLWRPEARCANVFVSRSEPWAVKVWEWDEADLQKGWQMFRSLLAYWCAKTGFDPSWEDTCDQPF